MVDHWLVSKPMSALFSRSASKSNKDESASPIVNLGDFPLSPGNEIKLSISDIKKGSLLRLFQSDVFDAHLHMYYLYHHKECGVHEYLVNLLYERSDDVLWYLPQLCELSVTKSSQSSLWKFFLDKASENMHFSLVLSWLYQAMVEDNMADIAPIAQNMIHKIEMAVVNSKFRPKSRYIEKLMLNLDDNKDKAIIIDNKKDNIDISMTKCSTAPSCESINNSINSPIPEDSKGGSSTGDKVEMCIEEALGVCGDSQPSSDDNTKIFSDSSSLYLMTIPSIGLIPSSQTITKSSKNLEPTANLSSSCSCDMLPDIWIRRILGDSIDSYGTEIIQENLSIINRQFKRLYTKDIVAAHYNPNRNLYNSSAIPFSVNVNSCGDSGKVPIPYFFFIKLGSPFELIDVGTVIKSIQGGFERKKAVTTTFDNEDYSDLLEEGFTNTEDFASYISEIEKHGESLYYLLKQHRCNYFNRINQFVLQILDISTFLQNHVHKEHRCEVLEFIFEELNLWLFYSRFTIAISRTTYVLNGLTLPMSFLDHIGPKSYPLKAPSPFNYYEDSRTSGRLSLNHCQFLKIVPNEFKVFNSRKRVHFLFVVEVADLDDNSESNIVESLVAKDILFYLQNHGISLPKNICKVRDSIIASSKNVSPHFSILLNFLSILVNGVPDSMDNNTSVKLSSHHIEDQVDLEDDSSCDSAFMKSNENNLEILVNDRHELETNWPQELWCDKVERIRQTSPFSSLRSWGLKTILLKSSDDLRQELLASQLLQQFDGIFRSNNLPLWLYPYEVLVVGAHGGFIEYIPDTFSIDGLKRRLQTDNLQNCFEKLFPDNNERSKARIAFVESHAAYSLVSYFLQVKDRHNGNFLLDRFGHIIQIDYGFMLSNSPGNVNFEQSPFKLTQEFLDIMLGENSSEFQYFVDLITRGFLIARKYVDQVILTIEIMTSSSKLPCFALQTNKIYLIQDIKDRFFLHLTEEQCILKISELIQTSINNWRSIQYDAFQRLTNGIL
ncbi:phosphatidylinositol 3- and 4-kinase family protein [Cryptosporidium andersoni]|uniref:1-phosphatidylinositol 4-kinase n=1 Tax=Cryptosporidium andersoni TaxID=117008 RepID=A0A1J4MUX5_9CRYT|nr:phosphatidylinositol 3- and 4-kinase family protein [Cryptosporidium andersoni]